jgi:OOP family OmpA-OmpF porin
MLRHPLHVTAALLPTVLLPMLVLSAGTATASSTSTGDDQALWPSLTELGLEPPSDSVLASSVLAWEPGGDVLAWEPGGGVRTVDTVEEDDDETVVTLSSDILFDPSDATLSAAAEQRVGELVVDVPDGAEVQVQGHTDTVDTDAANQDLSERRAQAVADAIAASRPDLDLVVEGFGESRLAEPETGDEAAVAEARAANRRVEIRYTG